MSVDYNPFKPEVKADPYPYYAALRREEPVYQIPGTDFYAVSRYEDNAEMLKQSNLFSSMGMRVVLMGGFGAALGVGDSTGVGARAASVRRCLKSESAPA